ncbi:MAG: bifunctional phosphopantothenoylcysteine decarboxylase/phosphopantothenate--cysteine ligase CoaBC, partial [Candidatus Aenigmarchaeota archaeon]|nr:bifunctional phosphopantothenoylcysteine decarboxylase/phosphopantothenate--cysteine ligase CoaBC [Candidatus Aenigmarchaeota archaeon]
YIVKGLRQHGAEVVIYATKNALKYIGKMTLEHATGNKVILKLSENSEHLWEYNAYIVAPATLNTINKMANGIADNAVATTLSAALGRVQKGKTKILVAPAMHGEMYENPALKKNIEFLKSVGVKFIEPKHEEGKAKLADAESIVAYAEHEMSNDPLKGKNVLINAGPTCGKIDNVRAITNIFTGRTGVLIADEAFRRGANVKLIYGSGIQKVPEYLNTVRVIYFEEMHEQVMKEVTSKKYDVGIFSAAISDYVPEKSVDGKIRSGSSITEIKLKPTSKIIKEVREKCPDMQMVTFKLENKISIEKLLEIGKKRLEEGYEIVVVNRLEDIDDNMHKSFIMNRDEVAETETKEETAKRLLDIIGKKSAPKFEVG